MPKDISVLPPIPALRDEREERRGGAVALWTRTARPGSGWWRCFAGCAGGSTVQWGLVAAAFAAGLSLAVLKATFPRETRVQAASGGVVVPAPLPTTGPRSIRNDSSLRYVTEPNAGKLRWTRDASRLKDAPGSFGAAAPNFTARAPGAGDDRTAWQDLGEPEERETWTGEGESTASNAFRAGRSSTWLSASAGPIAAAIGTARLQPATGGPAPTFRPNGRLAALRPRSPAAAGAGVSSRLGRSTLAMGQLKLASAVSAAATHDLAETHARRSASDAFEQAVVQDAMPASGPSIGPPEPEHAVVEPIGNGAPDMTRPSAGARDVTPFQPLVDGSRRLADSAASSRSKGLILLAVGAALIVAALALKINPLTTVLGAALYLVALGLIAAGAMMLLNAQRMVEDARRMADRIGSEFGQREQADILRVNADAKGSGQVYAPSTAPERHSGAGDAADAESRATYQLEPR